MLPCICYGCLGFAAALRLLTEEKPKAAIARYRYRWTPLAYRGYCCIYVF
ncbi:hypothetical protein T4D_14400 [Trichinella pseudospiralis]|uniref:Uncharacterized protein n=1 Tax=Trichinella pseudospiralis TaxID=6337 RepID=A0A0V1FN24_TRIPS|nr:hypothetical protein T4D_14400 [Trichinella pseudospiralis]